MGAMDQIIGSNPLTQSLMNRGIPLSVLAQQSPASTNFQPDLQVPPFPPMPDKSPMSIAGSQPQAPQAPQVPQQAPQVPPLGQVAPKPEETEAHTIVKALAQRLQTIGRAANPPHVSPM